MTAVHPLDRLIASTLVLLYLALVLPLPLLAPLALRPWLLLLVPLGLVLLLMVLSERVWLSDEGLQVGHPAWCRWLLRRGWSLRWDQIDALVPVGTSQGGKVFYLRRRGPGGGAVLLPHRIARFDAFLAEFSRRTGLDTSSVGRLTPPWTYQLLMALSGLMLAAELGTIATGHFAPFGTLAPL
jgi:hypothetical protein